MSHLMSCIFARKEHIESTEGSSLEADNLMLDGKICSASDDKGAVATSNSVTYADIRRQHIANISIFLRGSHILKAVSVPQEKSEEFFDSLVDEGNITAANTYEKCYCCISYNIFDVCLF